MTRAASEERIPSAIIDAAIGWAVKLDFGAADAKTRAGFERWVSAEPVHAQAWRRVQSLKDDFNAVPANLALDALNAVGSGRQSRAMNRRLALKGLLLVGATAGSGWAIRDHAPWQRLVADASTGVGEQRRLSLEDGTLIVLNTDSAIRTDFAGASRVVTLLRGEVSISTGADAAQAVKRPFLVDTPFGQVQALGTRFTVRLDEGGARIGVQEDAVALRPAGAPATAVAHAGESWWLDRGQAYKIATPAMDGSAWVDGAIVGKNMRLADLLAEFSRYRHFRISCAPEVADLRVSGTYHLADIDQALHFLSQTLPVRVRYWTQLWVRVGPA